jgi:glycerol kinase
VILVACVLAIDQGTTNTKAMLVDPEGAILASGSRPMRVDTPRPDWVQQSASSIWESVASLIVELAGRCGDADIAALAISNQRETTVIWDAETGDPIAPAITWQCRRTAAICDSLREGGHEEEVISRSGLGIYPMFPASKISWLLENVPRARARAERGELRAGTVDSWLIDRLTGGAVHATDHGNASRTQLLNLDSLEWDPVLAGIFGVPLEIMPGIRTSDSDFGATRADGTAIPEGIPVHAVLGDSHAALYAHGLTGQGRAKVTIGTGSSVMAVTERRVLSQSGLSGTIAWSRGGAVTHALEGNITVSGHAAAYAARLLGLQDEDELTRLAQSVPSSDGVSFVPALAGLGAPHWCSHARGTITGMSLGTRPAHVARAALEGIALQICDVVSAMESDLGADLSEIRADGGASRNAFLLQLLADLSNRNIARARIAEASALGVARMALESLGLASGARDTAADRYIPAMDAEQRDAIRADWSRAVRQASLT